MTREELAEALARLGVLPGGVLMVHTRMSAIGWIDRAEDGVVGALLDALGAGGTLMAYTSWDEHRYEMLDDPPRFDPASSRAARDHGRIPERVRTWPGALRSSHPEASVAAVGPRADWLTRDHPSHDAYGPAGPFGRLCDADGQVLMLGAPLNTITLLHHAEAIARVEGKRSRTFNARVAGGIRTYVDIDTEHGAVDYAALGLADDEFAVIGREALEAGIGVRGRAGEADCVLYPARELAAFGAAWIEARFG